MITSCIQVQLLQCTADAGSFRLSFRDELTTQIEYDVTSKQLETTLEELPNIADVQVTYSNGNGPLCDEADNIAAVAFTGVSGDVPALIVLENALVDNSGSGAIGSGEVAIATDGESFGAAESNRGTTTTDICSNHGLCDTRRGICKCFSGWASSNAYAGQGAQNDCGYRIPSKSTLRRAYGHNTVDP